MEVKAPFALSVSHMGVTNQAFVALFPVLLLADMPGKVVKMHQRLWILTHVGELDTGPGFGLILSWLVQPLGE